MSTKASDWDPAAYSLLQLKERFKDGTSASQVDEKILYEKTLSALDPASYMFDLMGRRITLELRVLLGKFMSRESIAISSKDSRNPVSQSPDVEFCTARNPLHVKILRKAETVTVVAEAEPPRLDVLEQLKTMTGLSDADHEVIKKLQEEAIKNANEIMEDIKNNVSDEDDFTGARIAARIGASRTEETTTKLRELHLLASLFDQLKVDNLRDLVSETTHLASNDVASNRDSKTLHAALLGYEEEKKRRSEESPAGDTDSVSVQGLYTNVNIQGENAWRALVYVAELKRYMDLIRLRKGIQSLEHAAMKAAQKISCATHSHDPSTVHRGSRVHKRSRSAYWVPHCYRQRYDDRAYLVFDKFANECFDYIGTEAAVVSSDATRNPEAGHPRDVADAQRAISELRRRITSEIPFDLVLLLAVGMQEIIDVNNESSGQLKPFDLDLEEKICLNVREMFLEQYIVDTAGVSALTQSVFHIDHGSSVTEAINNKWNQVTQTSWKPKKHGHHVWSKHLASSAIEWVEDVVEKTPLETLREEDKHDLLRHLRLRLTEIKVKTMDEVIKTDAVGTLIKTWPHNERRWFFRRWLKRLHRHQGSLVDVTQSVLRFRRWNMPQRHLEGRNTSKLVTNMLYRQTLVWAGMPFCPWLPCIAVVLEFSVLIIMYWAMMRGVYQTPNEPWSAGQTTSVFIENYMVTLLFCSVSITMWLLVEPSCGAHEGVRVFDTFGELYTTKTEQDAWLEDFDFSASGLTAMIIAGGAFFVRYMMNPPFLLLLLCVMMASRKLKEEVLSGMKAEGERSTLYHRLENMRLQTRLENYISKTTADPARELHQQKQQEQQTVQEAISSVLRSDMQNSMGVGSKRAKLIEKERRNTFRGVVTRVWTIPKTKNDTHATESAETDNTSDVHVSPENSNLLWMVHNFTEGPAGEGTRPLLYFNQTAVQCTAHRKTAGDQQQDEPASHNGPRSKSKSSVTNTYEYLRVPSHGGVAGTMEEGVGTDANRHANSANEVEVIVLQVIAKHGSRWRTCKPEYDYEYRLTLQGDDVLENFDQNSTLSLSAAKHKNNPPTEQQGSATNDRHTYYRYRVRVNDWMERHAEVDAVTGTPLTDRMVLEYKVEMLRVKLKDDQDTDGKQGLSTEDSLYSDVVWYRWCRHSDILNLQQTFGTCLRQQASKERRRLDSFVLPESHQHMNLHHLRFKRGYKDASPAALKRTAVRIQKYLNGFLRSFRHGEHVELHAMHNPYFLATCGALGGGDVDAGAAVSSAAYKQAHGPTSRPKTMQAWTVQECAKFCSDELLSTKATFDEPESPSEYEGDATSRSELEKVFEVEEIDGDELSVMTEKRLKRLLLQAANIEVDWAAFCAARERWRDDEHNAGGSSDAEVV
jgi:hypothetical protein